MPSLYRPSTDAETNKQCYRDVHSTLKTRQKPRKDHIGMEGDNIGMTYELALHPLMHANTFVVERRWWLNYPGPLLHIK